MPARQRQSSPPKTGCRRPLAQDRLARRPGEAPAPQHRPAPRGMEKTRALVAREFGRLAQPGGRHLSLQGLYQLARSTEVALPLDATHLGVLWCLDRCAGRG